MSDLIHNHYAVDGMQTEEEIQSLLSDLNTASKEKRWNLQFRAVPDFKGNGLTFICADEEFVTSAPAKYLSKKYPDKLVLHYTQDEFSDDEACFEWYNGHISGVGEQFSTSYCMSHSVM